MLYIKLSHKIEIILLFCYYRPTTTILRVLLLGEKGMELYSGLCQFIGYVEFFNPKFSVLKFEF